MSTLYIVPTPIGNLEDITFRALKILKEVDLILAEDTRKSNILLKKYDIPAKMLSHHKFNEHQYLHSIIDRLKEGKSIALISDAGTPGISDPGFMLIREAIRQSIEVVCLPGPTAIIPALVVSGMPTEPFLFEGFLPGKKGRTKRLKELSMQKETIVLYESPFRLLKTLNELARFFGVEREACIARELTKIYEHYQRGTLTELISYYAHEKIKGEIVIIIKGNKG